MKFSYFATITRFVVFLVALAALASTPFYEAQAQPQAKITLEKQILGCWSFNIDYPPIFVHGMLMKRFSTETLCFEPGGQLIQHFVSREGEGDHGRGRWNLKGRKLSFNYLSESKETPPLKRQYYICRIGGIEEGEVLSLSGPKCGDYAQSFYKDGRF